MKRHEILCDLFLSGPLAWIAGMSAISSKAIALNAHLPSKSKIEYVTSRNWYAIQKKNKKTLATLWLSDNEGGILIPEHQDFDRQVDSLRANRSDFYNGVKVVQKATEN